MPRTRGLLRWPAVLVIAGLMSAPINTYPGVSDGDGLAAVANRPAGHLIVVLFPTGTFIEAVFGRWRLADGRGSALIVSHRRYGQKAGAAMAAWLKANGPAVEQRLMALDQVPSHSVLEPSSP